MELYIVSEKHFKQYFPCVCAWVCICVGTSVRVHTCVVYVHVHVEAQGQCQQSFFITLLPYLLRQGLSVRPRTHRYS